jgi:hypothetical protein
MGIVFINQSTHVSDADVASFAEACDIQLSQDVSAAWNIASPLRVSTTPNPNEYQFFFVDTIPEAPNALAYHSVDNRGVPFGKIGVVPTLHAGEPLSSAASHEAVELQCDIYCASWSFSTRLRALVATESCDPVQSDTYGIKVSSGSEVLVSNFVTPSYFTDDALGEPLDHLRNLTQTFEIAPGGYQIRMNGGRVKNVFGDKVSDALRAGKEASQGRTFWRHVTMALALTNQAR